MATESDVRHLTRYRPDDGDELDDRIGFAIYYDRGVVTPRRDRSSPDLVRLYFDEDRLDGFYVPVVGPDRMEAGTPIGRPTVEDPDSAETEWDDVGATYRLEQDATIDGGEWDLLWYGETTADAEESVVAAVEYEPA